MRLTIALSIVIPFLIVGFIVFEGTRKARLNAQAVQRYSLYGDAWEQRTEDIVAALKRFKAEASRWPNSNADLLEFDPSFNSLFDELPFQSRSVEIWYERLGANNLVIVVPEPGFTYSGYYGYLKRGKPVSGFMNYENPYCVLSDLSIEFCFAEIYEESVRRREGE